MADGTSPQALRSCRPAPCGMTLRDKPTPATRRSAGVGKVRITMQRALEFGRQIAVDFEADADFDEGWCSPNHGFPPLRLRLTWTVGQPVQPVSNEMLRRHLTTTVRSPKGSLRPSAKSRWAKLRDISRYEMQDHDGRD